jgi:hypothetical protein
MRDSARIDPIPWKLSEVWKAHPDWRLGQLISNSAELADTFRDEDRAL